MAKAHVIFEEKVRGSAPDDAEDFVSAGSSIVAIQTRGLDDRGFAVDEVSGDRFMGDRATETAGPDDEVGNPEGAEGDEGYFEATPTQLAAAESGAETALSDLHDIEGFEPREAAKETAATVELPLRDAGAAIDGGQQEFFPAIGALVPTLLSTIGPAIAKGVMKRLSPRAKRVIERLPRPLGTAVVGAAGAVRGGLGTSDVLGLIAKLLETADQAPGAAAGEAGMEAQQALVEETAAILEVIIGTDDRVRITTTMKLPWRRYCALRITFPSGATYRGTGFLIGPRAAATAGHCVYLHSQGGWARRVEVIPGCNGSTQPYGKVVAVSLRSVSGWVTGKKPESDYGCVVLPAGAFGGRNLGSFGFAAFDPPALLAQPAVLAGYPGDKPFAESWGMARSIKSVTPHTLVYDIDTMGGQSGAPVYIKRNGQRCVVGIHNYGAATGNSATRVTRPVYERLLAWSKI